MTEMWMKKLIGAIAATLLLPAAYAQEGKKPMEKMSMEKMHMEKMHMEKKHDAMHEKMKEKMRDRHAAKKGEPAKKEEEHKH